MITKRFKRFKTTIRPRRGGKQFINQQLQEQQQHHGFEKYTIYNK